MVGGAYAKGPKGGFAHSNRRTAAQAVAATGKPPYNAAATFTAAALARPHPFPVSIVTGEFDPNLIANPGGSDLSLALLKKAGTSFASLTVQSVSY